MRKSFLACDETRGSLDYSPGKPDRRAVVRAFGREILRRSVSSGKTKYTPTPGSNSPVADRLLVVGDLLGWLGLVFIFGTVFCVRGTLTEGELLAFISYSYILMWPVRRLGRMIAEMSKAGVSIDRIAYILDSSRRPTSPALSARICVLTSSFRRSPSAYEEGKEVFSEVSFKIPKGTVFGILGGTGSGRARSCTCCAGSTTCHPKTGKSQ